MSAADNLGMYAEGWTTGDAGKINDAVSDSFIFDDPNAGKISKGEFSSYLDGMKETVRSLLGGDLPVPFMELTEIVTQENDGEITAWTWWAVPGTEIKGAGLIKAGDDGVRSEIITYYTNLPG